MEVNPSEVEQLHIISGDHRLGEAMPLNSGAPESERAPCVIVVGAGIAGLAAASLLSKASCKVMLLESRDRLGGRIHTDHSLGFPVDMGASWLHGVCKENPLASVIEHLKLPMHRTSGDNSILYDHDLESYALFDTDGGQVSADLVTQIGGVFKELLEECRIVGEEFSEDMSLQDALHLAFERRPDLRQVGPAHEVLQWYICRLEGWFATDTDKISLANLEEEILLDGGHSLMVEGYLPVILFLAEGLDIRLEHRVTNILQLGQGVRVLTDTGKVFDADAAVITAPLGVLKANVIRFEPKLPEWKEAAISELGVGNENKVAFLFDNVFWPNVEFVGVTAPTTYECSYFLNLHKATGHPILVYMSAGRLASHLEQLTDSEAASHAFLKLQRMFPNASLPKKYVVSRWGGDGSSLGCYSCDAFGKTESAAYDLLRAPVNNLLFFAGEATSRRFPGTVHGAFETGVLAASECRRCLDRREVQLEDSISRL